MILDGSNGNRFLYICIQTVPFLGHVTFSVDKTFDRRHRTLNFLWPTMKIESFNQGNLSTNSAESAFGNQRHCEASTKRARINSQIVLWLPDPFYYGHCSLDVGDDEFSFGSENDRTLQEIRMEFVMIRSDGSYWTVFPHPAPMLRTDTEILEE